MLGVTLLPLMPAASPPNLFLIVGDDMGWANAGWHSNHTKTPHMDAIIKDEGIELDRHFVFVSRAPARARGPARSLTPA